VARHLADVTDAEFERLIGRMVDWLKETNVAGSIAQDYSIYTALDEVRARAKANRRACRAAARREVRDWLRENR